MHLVDIQINVTGYLVLFYKYEKDNPNTKQIYILYSIYSIISNKTSFSKRYYVERGIGLENFVGGLLGGSSS